VVGTRIMGPIDDHDYYTAAVEVRTRDGPVEELDARPSDAILLALEAGAPILVARAALDRHGVIPRGNEPPPEPGPAQSHTAS
jgi:bifunctional DNase/RNase